MAALEEILALLNTEDELAKTQREIKELKDAIKAIQELKRQQENLRAQTENPKGDPNKLAPAQKDLAAKTQDVAKALDKNNKDDKGNPNAGGFVDLYPPLFSKLDNDTRGKLEKGPYFGYAYSRFTVPTKRKALLLFGANDIVSIWVNGRRMVNEAAPGNAKDCGAVEISLNNGANEILIKPGVTQGHLGFFCRVADETGRPFDDVTP